MLCWYEGCTCTLPVFGQVFHSTSRHATMFDGQDQNPSHLARGLEKWPSTVDAERGVSEPPLRSIGYLCEPLPSRVVRQTGQDRTGGFPV